MGAIVQVDAQTWKDGVVFPTKQTVNTYAWRDGAVAAGIVHDPDVAVAGVWTTTYHYTIVGGQAQLTGASIYDGRPRTVSYVNDFLGQAIRRDEADNLSGGDPSNLVQDERAPAGLCRQ